MIRQRIAERVVQADTLVNAAIWPAAATTVRFAGLTVGKFESRDVIGIEDAEYQSHMQAAFEASLGHSHVVEGQRVTFLSKLPKVAVERVFLGPCVSRPCMGVHRVELCQNLLPVKVSHRGGQKSAVVEEVVLFQSIPLVSISRKVTAIRTRVAGAIDHGSYRGGTR